MLNRVARRHRDSIGVLVGFNETMARRILGGSDFFLMPSRFEPCGLTQMQAQRYGALPIAHATGGLADTIEDGVTGFLFPRLSVNALLSACRGAFAVFRDQNKLAQMRHAAMTTRSGWELPAAKYEQLYCRLLRKPFPRLSLISNSPGAAKAAEESRQATPVPQKPPRLPGQATEGQLMQPTVDRQQVVRQPNMRAAH